MPGASISKDSDTTSHFDRLNTIVDSQVSSAFNWNSSDEQIADTNANTDINANNTNIRSTTLINLITNLNASVDANNTSSASTERRFMAIPNTFDESGTLEKAILEAWQGFYGPLPKPTQLDPMTMLTIVINRCTEARKLIALHPEFSVTREGDAFTVRATLGLKPGFDYWIRMIYNDIRTRNKFFGLRESTNPSNLHYANRINAMYRITNPKQQRTLQFYHTCPTAPLTDCWNVMHIYPDAAAFKAENITSVIGRPCVVRVRVNTRDDNGGRGSSNICVTTPFAASSDVACSAIILTGTGPVVSSSNTDVPADTAFEAATTSITPTSHTTAVDAQAASAGTSVAILGRAAIPIPGVPLSHSSPASVTVATHATVSTDVDFDATIVNAIGPVLPSSNRDVPNDTTFAVAVSKNPTLKTWNIATSARTSEAAGTAGTRATILSTSVYNKNKNNSRSRTNLATGSIPPFSSNNYSSKRSHVADTPLVSKEHTNNQTKQPEKQKKRERET
jgi:hypothetical protein